MFKALDRVQYNKLKLNEMKDKPQSPLKQVKSLAELSGLVLNWNSAILDENISSLPLHLIPQLLKMALIEDQSWAVTTIIANWPFETLRFSSLVTEDEADVNGLFEEGFGSIYHYVLDGIIYRTKHCKLKCIDFRGISLSTTFCRLIVQTWPFLSLRKTQLQPKKLGKVVAKAAGVTNNSKFTEDMSKILKERLDSYNLNIFERIVLPKGQKIEVKLEHLHFTTNNMFFMDYMICNCLRSLTPLYLTVSNIHIKSELVEGDVITDSFAPFLVLKGQDTQTLDGLSLRQLEEGIFYVISSDVQKCMNLQSLDMQDCNIYLQQGMTRSRTRARTHLAQTFQCFTHLRRLDLSFNYLLGCLGELLDALQEPLDYLSVRGCDLNETDLTNLAKSKHAPHLRELNLSKLRQFSIYDGDRICPIHLMQVMKSFPHLVLLNLSQNHLPESSIQSFCDTLATHLTDLKGLDIAGNIMQFEHQLDIVKACSKVPSMQWLRMTCVSNMLNDGAMLHNNPMLEMWQRFRDLLKSLGREDICVDVVKLSFAILVDLIDIFD